MNLRDAESVAEMNIYIYIFIYFVQNPTAGITI